MIQLNSRGEIADFQEADQFQPAKSQFECGFFACAMARSMAQVGKPPTLSMQQVINDAESWYRQYDGSDSISNVDGMTLDQEYSLLRQIGLHFQAISQNIDAIRTWVRAGYPVITAITEVSVRDLTLGGANPYPWTPAGTHVILVTGVASDGNLLVRDSANCTNLYDPNSLRPGPRKYDANALGIVTATVAVPPWLKRPTDGNTPPNNTQEEIIVLDIKQVSGYYIEDTQLKRWYLKKPDARNYRNNLFIGGDILIYYCSCTNTGLNGMSQYGLPTDLEKRLPGTKRATIQPFERGDILFDPDHEVDTAVGLPGPCCPAHIDSGPGRDLLAQPIIKAANAQITTLNNKIGSLTTQIAQLQQDLAAAQQANHADEVALLQAQITKLQQKIQQAQAILQAA